MVTAITQNIKVSVETIYQPTYSKPLAHEFVFAYRVIIENLSDNSIQLLHRHWHIWDSNGLKHEVKGEGVVGEQPTIDAFDSYQYVSGCPLSTEIGKMYGNYTMLNLMNNQEFQVQIPEFTLIAPFKYN